MTATLYRQPFLGLVAFGVAFLSRWLGHVAYALNLGWSGSFRYYASFAVVTAGAALIARSLRKDEITATWMGFQGAQLVWVGLFDLTFELYAELFAIPPYTAPSGLVSAGSGNLLMATLPIMLTVFLIYGLYNRQTRCNLIRWFHRNLRLTPGMPTPDNGRSVGRIVAMETLFVTWASYLLWLYAVYFGTGPYAIPAAYAGWAAWCGYIFWRLLKFPRVGPAFRYAIPVGILAWSLLEMPSHFGFYPGIWLKPFDYPVTTLAVVGIYVAGMACLANPPATPPRAAASGVGG